LQSQLRISEVDEETTTSSSVWFDLILSCT
jgi:hypothetical protein